jgi:hypothetical protein
VKERMPRIIAAQKAEMPPVVSRGSKGESVNPPLEILVTTIVAESARSTVTSMPMNTAAERAETLTPPYVSGIVRTVTISTPAAQVQRLVW